MFAYSAFNYDDYDDDDDDGNDNNINSKIDFDMLNKLKIQNIPDFLVGEKITKLFSSWILFVSVALYKKCVIRLSFSLSLSDAYTSHIQTYI